MKYTYIYTKYVCANACSLFYPEISWTVECSRNCEEGCQCDIEHLYDGHVCVPVGKCGCVQEGRRFRCQNYSFVYNLRNVLIWQFIHFY